MGAGIRYVGSIFIGLEVELKVKDRVKGKRNELEGNRIVVVI